MSKLEIIWFVCLKEEEILTLTNLILMYESKNKKNV